MSEPMGIALVWETLYGLWGIFEWDDVVKLQWTVLIDRNSKEIFEGDIVSQGEEYVGEVFWANGSFWYSRDNWWPIQDMRGEVTHFDGEVIGNIFENENLIKEKLQ